MSDQIYYDDNRDKFDKQENVPAAKKFENRDDVPDFAKPAYDLVEKEKASYNKMFNESFNEAVDACIVRMCDYWLNTPDGSFDKMIDEIKKLKKPRPQRIIEGL